MIFMEAFKLTTIVLLFFLAVDKGYSTIPSRFCEYSGLLAGAKDETDRKEREEIYSKLLGILDELSDYRSQYRTHGKPVNLFPSVYYHMTALEIDRIRIGEFIYPTEKMRQMLYFYDSYKFNRQEYDTKKVAKEEHWKRHFKEVEDYGFNIACQSIRKTINSAIRAHVRFDLARAIRHAFDNGGNSSAIATQLKGEFLTTNSIFSEAFKLALKDIELHSICTSDYSKLGDWDKHLEWLGIISLTEIKQWREEAFDNAIVNRVNPLQGYTGPLIAQPSNYPHSNYLKKGEKTCNKKANSTLFLFDLSGSMNGNGANSTKSKLQQAKDASKSTLNALRNNNPGTRPEVGVLGFSGGCPGPNGDPTTGDPNFTTDFSLAELRIDGMNAGGGTPLYEAIEVAQCKLAERLQTNGQKTGKLIVLSDGDATCKKIRPPGVYNSSKVYQWKIDVGANKCGGTSSPQIKYYTIGFNISPGSPAERDLQFLAQSTGGKYLNVQSQTQLERAFRKFNRTYLPKPNPAINNLPSSSNSQFDKGVSQINSESFTSALETCEAFVKLHVNDCHGAYNLALMQEANDFYKKAIANYQKYLSLCLNAPDKALVEKQIIFLEEEFKQFLLFQKEVIKSDLEYLKLHFEKIQNGQSVVLAEEFKGFLKEKGVYYINLPELMGRTDRLFKKNTKEVADGLDNCAKTIKRNPKTWDRDATPVLSMTYLNLERLLDSL